MLIWMLHNRRSTRVLAILFPIALGALLWAIRAHFDAAAAALAFVLFLCLAAFTGDRWTGFLASAASALAFDFFLVTPMMSFHIHAVADIQLAVMMLLVGLAITEMARWAYRERATATEHQALLGDVLQASFGAKANDLAEQLLSVLDADAVDFVAAEPDSDDMVFHPDGTVRVNGVDQRVSTSGMPTTAPAWLPVTRNGEVLGSFRVTTSTHGSWPTPEKIKAAIALAHQLTPGA